MRSLIGAQVGVDVYQRIDKATGIKHDGSSYHRAIPELDIHKVSKLSFESSKASFAIYNVKVAYFINKSLRISPG